MYAICIYITTIRKFKCIDKQLYTRDTTLSKVAYRTVLAFSTYKSEWKLHMF